MIKKQKDEEARKTLAKTELQFFNTNNTMAPIIMGVDCALQDQTGAEAADTIAALKTGMMGPLAGIGDTLFHVCLLYTSEKDETPAAAQVTVNAGGEMGDE